MDKIAILDDDEQWSLSVKRYFRNHYEVTTFKRRFNFLQAVGQFDLVIIDFSIPPANFETDIDGCGIIAHLKQTLKNPPILVMASGFISKNSPELGYEICPEADDFFAKDEGLEAILQRTQQLLANRVMKPR